tara:strand:+ start:3394 stop:4164 length:771 start_codon:yes stop_codon:yes gene_type:complete
VSRPIKKSKILKIAAIIPARMGSSRFYGKPMKKINGIPMIGIVHNNALKAKNIDFVCVATCDREIHEYIKSIGGISVLTSKKHERASERTAEALLKIEKKTKKKYDIVVMIQGDEPMIKPYMISKSIMPFIKNNKTQIVNLMTKIISNNEFNDVNEPKVVVNKKLEAIYFSRCPIPSTWKKTSKNIFKQVCVIPFKREALIEFNKNKPTFLEKMESIDMNRVIENGGKIQMVEINEYVKSVDTNADMKLVKKLMKN